MRAWKGGCKGVTGGAKCKAGRRAGTAGEGAMVVCGIVQ
jgi:hypothetical protein